MKAPIATPIYQQIRNCSVYSLFDQPTLTAKFMPPVRKMKKSTYETRNTKAQTHQVSTVISRLQSNGSYLIAPPRSAGDPPNSD